MRSWAARLLDLALLAVILAGLAARIAGLPTYVPDSGDEWGNTLTPLRVLHEGGNPGSFLHPSLFYYVAAAVYAVTYAAGWVLGGFDRALSMADLFVLDERWFVFAARAVSVASAALAMGALYALGRRLWNRLAGLTAAALLAVLPLHAVYSEAVRVDSFFLAVFLAATAAIVRALEEADGAAPTSAAVLTGLAIGANYNGAILLPWLLAALLLRPAGASARDCGRALLLAAAAFLVSSPFVLLDAGTFARHVAFIASLSTTEHPGMEGRDALFYARELVGTAPLLAAVIAVASLLTLLLGNRAERFVLALPLAYFALFSYAVRTKFDRFILPALALLLLFPAGLPALLARRLAARRIARAVLPGLACGLLVACLAGLWPRAIPVPGHEMLARPDAALFDWLGARVPPRSTVLVEAGLVPLLDAMDGPGPLAAELQRSLVRIRPDLDHRFLGASFVGGTVNYGAGILSDGRVDYAVVSSRNLRRVAEQCDAYPEVCAFYRQLQAHGRLVFTTPEGVEPVAVYQVGAPGPQ